MASATPTERKVFFFIFDHTEDGRSARAELAHHCTPALAKRTLAILMAVVYLSKKYLSEGCAVHTFSNAMRTKQKDNSHIKQ